MKYLLWFLFPAIQLFSQQRIDTNQVLNIGGIKQYVRIKGKDISKPLLLIYMGGLVAP